MPSFRKKFVIFLHHAGASTQLGVMTWLNIKGNGTDYWFEGKEH
jgi:hypothetical protein